MALEKAKEQPGKSHQVHFHIPEGMLLAQLAGKIRVALFSKWSSHRDWIMANLERHLGGTGIGNVLEIPGV